MITETMSMSTKIAHALALTLLGMGVVFTALIIISVALDALRVIIAGLEDKTPRRPYPVKNLNLIKNRPVGLQEKKELIAAITAAVAAYAGSKTDRFMVRSIRPRHQNNPLWSSAGRQQQMAQRLKLAAKSIFRRLHPF